jgi:hypothetical protein
MSEITETIKRLKINMEAMHCIYTELRQWAIVAGICPECGGEIQHDIDLPQAGCTMCHKDFMNWTSAPPLIQRLRAEIEELKNPHWMAVDVQLPSNNEPVWFVRLGRVNRGIFRTTWAGNEVDVFITDAGSRFWHPSEGVTHWMPSHAPAPPRPTWRTQDICMGGEGGDA